MLDTLMQPIEHPFPNISQEQLFPPQLAWSPQTLSSPHLTIDFVSKHSCPPQICLFLPQTILKMDVSKCIVLINSKGGGRGPSCCTTQPLHVAFLVVLNNQVLHVPKPDPWTMVKTTACPPQVLSIGWCIWYIILFLIASVLIIMSFFQCCEYFKEKIEKSEVKLLTILYFNMEVYVFLGSDRIWFFK